MELSITDTKKVIQFAVIINNLKNILDEINFNFSENGLYFQGMDSGHVSLVEMFLDCEWFDSYKTDKSYCLGIHVPCLDTILSCLNKGYTINIKYQDGDKLNITLTDDKIVKKYGMILIEFDDMTMDVKNPEYTSDIIMKSSAFKDYITELLKFGETLKINTNEKDIILSTKGEFGKSQIIIDEKYLEVYAIEEDVVLEQNYNMKMIKLFTNFTNLNKIVNIHLLEQMPMKMQFSLNDEAPEKNKITFYLAPKIDD
jgi:proliferating cell nuclear antigen PCNA